MCGFIPYQRDLECYLGCLFSEEACNPEFTLEFFENISWLKRDDA